MSFLAKTQKWKKCVWTAPACTDRMSDLPENYTFLRCCLSFSGVFPRDRFLCTFWAPRPPKPQKLTQKGCHLSPVLGPFFQTWSHLGPQVPKMTPRDPKTEPPSLPREPKREKSAQNDAKPTKTTVLWEVQCAIRTRRRSPNTLFACLH